MDLSGGGPERKKKGWRHRTFNQAKEDQKRREEGNEETSRYFETILGGGNLSLKSKGSEEAVFTGEGTEDFSPGDIWSAAKHAAQFADDDVGDVDEG